MITNDIFVSFLYCNRKAFLRTAGVPGRPTEIELVLLDLGQTYRRQALQAFLSCYDAQDVSHDPVSLDQPLKSRAQVSQAEGAMAPRVCLNRHCNSCE